MDLSNIQYENTREIDRIIKLVDEYNVKLRNLVKIYNNRKIKRILIYAISLIISIIMVSGVNLYFEYISLNDSEITTIAWIIISTIGFIAFLIFLMSIVFTFFDSRNYNDIMDEIVLTNRQLKKLISIASQAKEHLYINENTIIKFEIDLKLFEAETLIKKVSQNKQFKKMMYYSINDEFQDFN